MSRLSIDTKSIHFKLLIYFSLFAIVILALIGGMEILLFNNFYGTMKERDTVDLAYTIKDDFQEAQDEENFDIDAFCEYYASNNDVSVLIMKKNGDYLERVTGSTAGTSIYTYISETSHPYLWRAYKELEDSNEENGSDEKGVFRFRRRSARIVTDKMSGGRNMLAYACYLDTALPETENVTEGDASYDGDFYVDPASHQYILFILSPLYPTTSTIRILTNILVTIFGFAFSLVLIMALYLSQRISKPIKDITRSAEKLSKGDYDVPFEGGHYTEITELADTLEVAEREMKKTEMYQKDLIANVSHDIRTPLTMIRSYAEMIHDISGDDPEKRNKHLDIIIEETDRLNALVNDMLNLSRLQSRKLKLEKTVFDISKTSVEVLSSYDILEEKEGYHITYTDDGPCFVEADENKIRQVMNNLLTNAVKYCGEDKEIMVRLVRSGDEITFQVSDHGQGIAEDELPHVWDRYYKSSTHHVRETSGSGLGLSIVREILKMHDAEHGVSSKVGKGSTFWFKLPVVKG